MDMFECSPIFSRFSRLVQVGLNQIANACRYFGRSESVFGPTEIVLYPRQGDRLGPRQEESLFSVDLDENSPRKLQSRREYTDESN